MVRVGDGITLNVCVFCMNAASSSACRRAGRSCRHLPLERRRHTTGGAAAWPASPSAKLRGFAALGLVGGVRRLLKEVELERSSTPASPSHRRRAVACLALGSLRLRRSPARCGGRVLSSLGVEARMKVSMPVSNGGVVGGGAAGPPRELCASHRERRAQARAQHGKARGRGWARALLPPTTGVAALLAASSSGLLSASSSSGAAGRSARRDSWRRSLVCVPPVAAVAVPPALVPRRPALDAVVVGRTLSVPALPRALPSSPHPPPARAHDDHALRVVSDATIVVRAVCSSHASRWRWRRCLRSAGTITGGDARLVESGQPVTTPVLVRGTPAALTQRRRARRAAAKQPHRLDSPSADSCDCGRYGTVAAILPKRVTVHPFPHPQDSAAGWACACRRPVSHRARSHFARGRRRVKSAKRKVVAVGPR